MPSTGYEKLVHELAAGWCTINKMDPSVQQATVHSFVIHAHRNVEIVAYYNMAFVPLSADEIIIVMYGGARINVGEKKQKSPCVTIVSSYSF